MSKKYKWGILILSALALLVAISQLTQAEEIQLGNPQVSVTGKISDETEVAAGIELIQKNLQAATDEDVEAYVETLITSARADTRKEMATFFKDYQLIHTVLSVQVLKQEPTQLTLQVTQQTVTKKGSKQKKTYRPHISEAHHTLIKEDGQWKIAETAMSDTKFI